MRLGWITFQKRDSTQYPTLLPIQLKMTSDLKRQFEQLHESELTSEVECKCQLAPELNLIVNPRVNSGFRTEKSDSIPEGQRFGERRLRLVTLL